MVTKKINLVVFTREYPIGMAGTKRVQNFLDYLLLRDLLITVISFRSHLPQPAITGTHNSIPYLNIGPGIEMKLSQILRVLMYYFKGIKTILHLRKRDCTNIVYNSGGINIENVLFIIWAKLLGFKLILAIEEDYTFFKDDIKPISKFKCWTIRRFDFLNCRWAGAIIVISTFLRDKYVKLRAKNVSLIPITAKINCNKSKNSFNQPLQVLYAGTFADKDGVDDIIEGFLTFNSSYDEAELVLTGKSSQQLHYQEKYSDKKNLVFKGFVEDNEFYSLLRDSDVLCMCRNESGFANAGFPFKLGEYLATGNPVICTKVSDVKFYLDEKDAFLIDPGNPGQISESLIRIVRNPEVARKTGLNGLEKCRKFFSPEVNGQKLYDILMMVSA